MNEIDSPQPGPRTKDEFAELARTMQHSLKDMAEAVSDFENAIDAIPEEQWPIDTANFARAWNRTEYVKALRYEASYLRAIAQSLRDVY